MMRFFWCLVFVLVFVGTACGETVEIATHRKPNGEYTGGDSITWKARLKLNGITNAHLKIMRNGTQAYFETWVANGKFTYPSWAVGQTQIDVVLGSFGGQQGGFATPASTNTSPGYTATWEIGLWGDYNGKPAGWIENLFPGLTVNRVADIYDSRGEFTHQVLTVFEVGQAPCPERTVTWSGEGTFHLAKGIHAQLEYSPAGMVFDINIPPSKQAGTAPLTIDPHTFQMPGDGTVKLVIDGKVVWQKTFECQEEVQPIHVTFTGDPPTAPTDPESPTEPTKDPGPKPGPDPGPGGNPPPNGGGGGTAPSPFTPVTRPPTLPGGGGYTGSTEQEDIYQAVYKALNDAGNAKAGAAMEDTAPDDATGVLEERADLDDVQNRMNEALWNTDNLKKALSTKLVEFAQPNLPQTIGKVSTIQLGHLAFKGDSRPITLNLNDWQGMIGTIRTVILWISGVLWTFACVHLVRGYL